MFVMYVHSNSMANTIHLHQGLDKDDPRDHEDGPKRLLRLLDQPEQGNQWEESLVEEQKRSLCATTASQASRRLERF